MYAGLLNNFHIAIVCRSKKTDMIWQNRKKNSHFFFSSKSLTASIMLKTSFQFIYFRTKINFLVYKFINHNRCFYFPTIFPLDLNSFIWLCRLMFPKSNWIQLLKQLIMHQWIRFSEMRSVCRSYKNWNYIRPIRKYTIMFQNFKYIFSDLSSAQIDHINKKYDDTIYLLYLPNHVSDPTHATFNCRCRLSYTTTFFSFEFCFSCLSISLLFAALCRLTKID